MFQYFKKTLVYLLSFSKMFGFLFQTHKFLHQFNCHGEVGRVEIYPAGECLSGGRSDQFLLANSVNGLPAKNQEKHQ